MMNATGGNHKFISKNGEYPTFTKDGKRIFYQTGGVFFGELTKALKSVDLNGKDERTHIQSKYANRLVVSPDNNWIAFSHLHKVYLAPLNINGQTADLDNKSTAVPVSILAKDAGINLHWSANSQQVMWTLGETYFKNNIKDRFTFLPDSPEKVNEPSAAGIAIGLKSKVDKPKGSIAFTNARIITMEGDEVIDNGSIVINQTV